MKMYRCNDCGHLFEDGEQVEWNEMHGEKLSGCPLCKGHYEEISACVDCGGYSTENNDFPICDICIQKYNNNVNICYEIGKNDTEDISLNCFLTSMFEKEEIEELLLEHLIKQNNIDCSRFIESDKYWFVERLCEVIENEKK